MTMPILQITFEKGLSCFHRDIALKNRREAYSTFSSDRIGFVTWHAKMTKLLAKLT